MKHVLKLDGYDGDEEECWVLLEQTPAAAANAAAAEEAVRRTRRQERARTAESRVRFLGCRWAKASFLTRNSGTGGPHFLTLRFLNARRQLYVDRASAARIPALRIASARLLASGAHDIPMAVCAW